MLQKGVAGQDRHGRLRHYTRGGLRMHSSLAVTVEGLPLGLAAMKFCTRKKFKGTNALRGKVNLTRVPIEEKESVRWLENVRESTALFQQPERCVHIGDRESDLYELFWTAHQAGTHFSGAHVRGSAGRRRRAHRRRGDARGAGQRVAPP